MKRCSRCGAEKSKSDFQVNRALKDGLDYWCRPCRQEKDRARWKKRDVEKVRNSKRAYREKNKPEIKRRMHEYYLSRKKEWNERGRKWYEANKERVNAANREKYKFLPITKEYLAKAAARQRKHLKKRGRRTPWYGAHGAVYLAVRCGLLKKLPCAVCGKEKVEGHHPNGYDLANWFTVIWLCHKHHMGAHGRNSRG